MEKEWGGRMTKGYGRERTRSSKACVPLGALSLLWRSERREFRGTPAVVSSRASERVLARINTHGRHSEPATQSLLAHALHRL